MVHEALLSQGCVLASFDVVSDLQNMDERSKASTPETQTGQI